MDHGVCRSCGLLFLQITENCSHCGGAVTPLNRASAPGTGAGAGAPPPDSPAPQDSVRPIAWEIAYKCGQQFEAITLKAELERHGILSWVRSLEVGGYPAVVFNETIWGWLLVDKDDLTVAREVISQFFADIQPELDPETSAAPSAEFSEHQGDQEE